MVVLQEGFILRKVSGFKLLLCYKEFLKHIVQHALHLVDSCLEKNEGTFSLLLLHVKTHNSLCK